MDQRRTRSKIDELGLNEEVDALLAKGLTYEDIAAYIQEKTGESIGKSSVARYNKSVQRRLSQIRAMQESANALAAVLNEKKSGDDAETHTAELLLAVVQHTLLDRITHEEMNPKELVSLAFASNDAVRTQTAIEKLRQTERRRFAKAWQQVMDEARELLRDSGLWPAVEQVLIAGQRSAIGQE